MMKRMISHRGTPSDPARKIFSLSLWYVHSRIAEAWVSVLAHTLTSVSLLSGLSKNNPPPEPEMLQAPMRGPPRSEPDGETCDSSIYSTENKSKARESSVEHFSSLCKVTSAAGPPV